MKSNRHPLKIVHDWLLAHDRDVEKRYKIAGNDQKEIKNYWVILALIPLLATVLFGVIAILLLI